MHKMKHLTLRFALCTIIALISCNRASDSTSSPAGQNKTEDSVGFFSPAQIDHLLQSGLDSVVKSGNSTLLAAQILGASGEGAPYLVVVRTGPGSVEVHEQWDDVVIMRSGHGILKTGYHVDGDRKESSSGDWVGGMIEGGKERSVSPGDFIIIPAMVAHQYIPHRGDSLTYWTIKVRRPKK
jgi:mannose-6-phosphate isomerase-like protein (cupin superfamily)